MPIMYSEQKHKDYREFNRVKLLKQKKCLKFERVHQVISKISYNRLTLEAHHEISEARRHLRNFEGNF